VGGQRLAVIAWRRPVLTQRIAFAAERGLQRIASQLVMIIEVFIAQDQALNTLSEQFLQAVFNITRVAVVDETVAQGS